MCKTALSLVIHYTIMDFSAGVHDVICTRKINNDVINLWQKTGTFSLDKNWCTSLEKRCTSHLYFSKMYHLDQ